MNDDEPECNETFHICVLNSFDLSDEPFGKAYVTIVDDYGKKIFTAFININTQYAIMYVVCRVGYNLFVCPLLQSKLHIIYVYYEL